jgi:hypothetical protein
MDLTDLRMLRRAAAARAEVADAAARRAAAVPPFAAVSPAWQACGFSSDDPALEFRATGLLGKKRARARMATKLAALALDHSPVCM